MKSRAAGRAPRETPKAQIERLEAKNRELTRTLQIIEEARTDLADQYDYAPIGFLLLDAKGCIRQINLTAARMLGRERSHLVTMPFFTHVAKSHCGAFLRHLRECRRHPGEVISELTLRLRGSTALSVEMRSVPVPDPHRGGTVYRTTITDITERLRASQALSESEERYRELVEFLPDGVFIVIDGVIVFANGAALRLCGAEKVAELLGHNLVEWMRPAFRPAMNAMLQAAPARYETPTIEAKIVRGNGTAVDVEIATRAFRYQGEPAMLVVARDISRRKTAERQVLAISERERSGFGRDLHDGLCQSLAGAAWMGEMLQNKIARTDAKAAAEAEAIVRVVRGCVEEARILARGLCPVMMERSGLVAALHDLTAKVTSLNRVGCTLECDDLLTVNDTSVATNLYRIAQEAVANAIRHAKPKTIHIQLVVQNGKMALCVQDDGKGIPVRPKQTGMGLHTMRYRATIIGGSLEVRRGQPRGTIVTCTFPNSSEPS